MMENKKKSKYYLVFDCDKGIDSKKELRKKLTEYSAENMPKIIKGTEVIPREEKRLVI